MRFRLVRSKAFWLGVPGLVFLLWAWGDSFLHRALVGFKPPGAAAGASCQGVLYIAKEPGAGVNWGSPRVEYNSDPGYDVVAYLQETQGYEYYYVKYAVVVALYVVAWGGLLVWRARKYRAVVADAPADRNGP